MSNKTENTENTETDFDPKTFDLTDWLTPVNEKKHRKTETVDLVRDFSLEAEIYELNGLEYQLKRSNKNSMPADDRSIADGSKTQELEQRKAELHKKLANAVITVKVRAMMQPEIDEALDGMKPANQMYWPRLFEHSVEMPDGSYLPADKWPQLRNTIGEGQFAKIVDAFNTATYKAPVTINAPK